MLTFVALLFGATATAHANSPQQICRSNDFFFESAFHGNVSYAEASWIPEVQREPYWTKSVHEYNRELKRLQSICPTPGVDRDFALAYLISWRAILDHHYGKVWLTNMNLANQLLRKCVVAFYGSEKGAQCETDLEANIRRKISWELSPVPHRVMVPRRKAQTTPRVFASPVPLSQTPKPVPSPYATAKTLDPAWYSGDALVDGHPYLCRAASSEDDHVFLALWSADACTGARKRWAKLHPEPSPTPQAK